MPYDPTVAHISTHISALGNTPVLIHFTLCIVWHIDQSEPIEHSVDVGHAPDIAQRFWTVNHCSDLFHIAQRQQHRAPRQTFAVFPAVDPEFPCVFAASAFSYFIREWQAGIGFKTHFLMPLAKTVCNFSANIVSKLYDHRLIERSSSKRSSKYLLLRIKAK